MIFVVVKMTCLKFPDFQNLNVKFIIQVEDISQRYKDKEVVYVSQRYFLISI